MLFNGMRARVIPYLWEMVALDPGTREDIFCVPVFSCSDMEEERRRLITACSLMRRPFLIQMFRRDFPGRDRPVTMHDGAIQVGFGTMEEWEGFRWGP